MGTISVPWDKTAVRNYLDKELDYWNEIQKDEGTVDKVKTKAYHYIGALQDVRIALFGEMYCGK